MRSGYVYFHLPQVSVALVWARLLDETSKLHEANMLTLNSCSNSDCVFVSLEYFMEVNYAILSAPPLSNYTSNITSGAIRAIRLKVLHEL